MSQLGDLARQDKIEFGVPPLFVPFDPLPATLAHKAQ
jgi:hypothetical protein